MRLAAVDTSSRYGSVALLEQGAGGSVTVVRDLVSDLASAHAAQILALLQRLLDDAGWARTTLDAFASTRGPGSFTGVRVGLGTVRGLALAAARPALGIGTLDAMAETVADSPRERVPLLVAGRGEVFGARFDARSRPPRQLIAPWVGPVERALVLGGPEGALFGSGAVEFLPRLRAAGFHDELTRTVESAAAAAGRLAFLRLATGARDGDGLAPLYVRPPDAEIRVDGSGSA